MLNINMIQTREEIATKIAELKVWLSQKEVVEYSNWKAQPENEKARDAMDKVTANLKLADDKWLEKEAELRSLEPRLKSMDLCINSLMAMIASEKYDVETFKELEGSYETIFEI